MKRKTLFDPKAIDPRAYEIFVDLHERNDRRDFCGDELCIFNDVLDGERAFSYDVRGAVSGNLRMKIEGIGTVDGQHNEQISIPVWPEPEFLSFQRCDAKAVVLIEKGTISYSLAENRAGQFLNVILIHSVGLPRFNTRRFAHRLCTQFNLPLYILADNDTWGYFMFSLMKRGVVDPAKEFPYAAVKDTRFLGMRCKDVDHFDDAKIVKIPQKSYWKYRIAALRKYACFKSKAWQQEFDAFEKQKGKFELDALVGRKGIDYVIQKYLKPKLEQGDYLK